jgi:hypothetical protein
MLAFIMAFPVIACALLGWNARCDPEGRGGRLMMVFWCLGMALAAVDIAIALRAA